MKLSTDRILAEMDHFFSVTRSSLPDISMSKSHFYTVRYARRSESAWILFVEDDETARPVVMKLLRPCKDVRYNLLKLDRRQECQLEALEWNKLFTPDVYLGLGYVQGLRFWQRKIVLGGMIEDIADRSLLDSGAEYVLLMRQLPFHRQLDQIIQRSDDAPYWKYMQRLIKILCRLNVHISTVHKYKTPQVPYGSAEQIYKKLEHILTDVDKVLKDLHRQRHFYSRWGHNLEEIREELPEIIKQERYRSYFEQRRHEGRIRRCHGDLKASNIWVMPSHPRSANQVCRGIQVLDTIDFNPLYCNIDVISDFAMLAVDIQAYMKSQPLIHFLIEHYLMLTDQQDAVARSVLAYYLVEKALVRAIVSIHYDKEVRRGLHFLEIAARYMHALR